MPITIRKATINDALILANIEAECFPAAEAATLKSIQQRIKTFPNSFFIAEEGQNAIGFINGCVTNSRVITDDMFEDVSTHNPNGDFQAIFGLDVIPQKRKNGVAAMLMKHIIDEAKKSGRKGLILTCKERLIHYYEKFGYKNIGVSNSTHGGAVWYDMILEF